MSEDRTKRVEDHPLSELHQAVLGKYHIQIQELRPLRLSGWRGFALALRNPAGVISSRPVIEGIYSAGGKDQVRPWMDISVAQYAVFGDGQQVDLHALGLTSELFQHLSRIIPAGGHLMVSYEDNDAIHRQTDRALTSGVPPVLTPLGYLLFVSGFRLVKNWYLAEGGHEGPRKLWGEKAPEVHWSVTWDDQTARELVYFFDSEKQFGTGMSPDALLEAAREVFSQLSIDNRGLRRKGDGLFGTGDVRE